MLEIGQLQRILEEKKDSFGKKNCFSLKTISLGGRDFSEVIVDEAEENSRGLNCQFDICSGVRELSSFYQKFRAFN